MIGESAIKPFRKKIMFISCQVVFYLKAGAIGIFRLTGGAFIKMPAKLTPKLKADIQNLWITGR